MDLLKCKICGGEILRSGSHYVCKYCKSKWQIDAADDVHAVDRANAWAALRDGDFEHATELFENIILKDAKEHEAYWGRALSRGGIVYVTDLSESKKVPTCNNITESSFLKEKDVQKAIELAPTDIAQEYQKQAEYIEKVRIEWLEKASKEPAYDVFISFKDSDREHGIERTQDSIDAQDLYNALVAEGYKVFFSRISLRDKVAEQYEPYIYNAIKTAKVMIVFGEKPEYFSAVWLKNEWSRFKARIEKGEKHKNSLVVVYKNMNPGDLPSVLKSRQCLNAADMTFLSGLNKHIKRVIAESQQAMHLDRIEIKGGQIAKKATRIANESIQMRELGQGAVAETSISEKQTLDLAKSYMKGKQWEDAAKLIDDILFDNPNYAEALWCQLTCKYHVQKDAEILSRLPQFTQEDYGQIEKTLSCANKAFATTLLDLLYGAEQTVTEEVYQSLLKTILPFNYEHRQERIQQSFENAIAKERFAIFHTLLSTLPGDDVDTYIKHNLAYAAHTKAVEQKKQCVEAVLKVDGGNVEALKMRFEMQWDTATANELTATLESILKYAPAPEEELGSVLQRLTKELDSAERCAFARQALKYHSGDLAVLKDVLIELSYRMIEHGFFEDAQYLLNLVLTFDPANPKVYWGICRIKVKAKTDEDIIISEIPLKSIPEYTKYLTLVDEAQRQNCFKLVQKQEKAFQKHKNAKKAGITAGIIAAIGAVIGIIVCIMIFVVKPAQQYDEAMLLLSQEKYDEAFSILESIPDYKDSREVLHSNKYDYSLRLIEEGDDVAAYKFLSQIPSDYKDSAAKIKEIQGRAQVQAGNFAKEANYQAAIDALTTVGIKKEDFAPMAAYQAMADGKYGEATTLGITDIILPNNITQITNNAFEGCTNLKSIYIPSSVTRIGSSAFKGCTGLTSISIPSGVTQIDSSAFKGCTGLTNVTIPYGVSSIESFAFENCTQMTSISIPSSVTKIKSDAFRNCTSLQSVTIPNSVSAVASDAFENCKIQTATIPANAASAMPKAYIKTVTITGGDSLSGFSSCTQLTSVAIPNTVKTISSSAFNSCKNLTSIEIPSSVTSIGSDAFKYCSGLTSITLPFVGATLNGTKNTHFGYIFGAISSIYNDDYVPASLKTVVITGGTSIASDAFYNCARLTSITIPNSVTSIGSSAFKLCSRLSSIKIPSGVTSIGYGVFYSCSSLTSIEIPSGVTSIGENAFYFCSSLTSIEIPSGVTSIGDYAFQNCTDLTSITIPSSVTSIGHYAFDDCSGLANVMFEETTGWWRNSWSSTATSGTNISPTDLADFATAAKYLTSTYCNSYWKRG